MGLLDGDLARTVYAAFRGKLKSGVLRITDVPDDAVLDDYGDALGTPRDLPIEGFTENYDAAYAARAGYPRTDLVVNIFAQSIPGIEPPKDAKVGIGPAGARQWYQIREAKTDPATALWQCRSFAIPDQGELS